MATPWSHSLIVFGPSGSGKTSAFVEPAALEWDCPAVISGTEADLLSITATTRAASGAVMVYDPFDRLTSSQRVGWDPLATCDTYEGAAAMAEALVGLSDFRSAEQGDLWQASATSLLGPLLLAASRSAATVREVRQWLNNADWDTALGYLGADPEAADTLEFVNLIWLHRDHNARYRGQIKVSYSADPDLGCRPLRVGDGQPSWGEHA